MTGFQLGKKRICDSRYPVRTIGAFDLMAKMLHALWPRKASERAIVEIQRHCGGDRIELNESRTLSGSRMDGRRNSRVRYVLEPSIRNRFGDSRNPGTGNRRYNGGKSHQCE